MNLHTIDLQDFSDALLTFTCSCPCKYKLKVAFVIEPKYKLKEVWEK